MNNSEPSQAAGYELADFSEIQGVPCPCGTAYRAFEDVEDFPGTVHVTEICMSAKLHYHKQLTETYYFLECDADAQMQLDDGTGPPHKENHKGDLHAAECQIRQYNTKQKRNADETPKRYLAFFVNGRIINWRSA